MYVNVKVEPPSTFTITRTFHILPLFYERAYILRAHAHNTRQETVRSDDATATRTSKITIGLEDKTIVLHMHLTFWYTSLPFLHDYDVKCLILLFREDVNERRRNFILSLNLNMVLRNSTLGGFGYIWQRKWVGIIAMKTERTQVQFWSDVFGAVASSGRKFPNYATVEVQHKGHPILTAIRRQVKVMSMTKRTPFKLVKLLYYKKQVFKKNRAICY